MYPKKQLAQLVISACQFYNIDTVVISPGSRNAPLTIGFTNHPDMETYSIVDERCAAFFAMGIAQQKRKPVAIVCTSGSALLNYYPAIAEAFYSKIPLLVISADRPRHLIDVGDGQAIRQENVFANHILYSANLVEDTNELGRNAEMLNEAISTAIQKKGPIHVNVPFEEPLYEVVDEMGEVIKDEVLKISKEELTSTASNINYEYFADIWNSAERKLILIGVNYPSDELQSILSKYANDESVLIMTETTSNLYGSNFVNNIDVLITPLNEKSFEALQPDVLITLGGMVVSKRIKQFLRKYQPKHHWHIDKLEKLDTYFCLSEFVQEVPEMFFLELINYKKKISSSYKEHWLEIENKRIDSHENFVKTISYSDLEVFNVLLKSIPNNCQLQLSNSSVIRYTQLFKLNPTLRVFCNRGTSGIDGSTSTAIGAALASKEQTVFISGDISFYYDSNALWNSYVPSNFRIIIVNNSGGGIFKIIPGPQTTNALNYFETPHSLNAEYLAKTYGFEYESVTNVKELENKLSGFYSDSLKPKILEIFTPSSVNDSILKKYFKNL
ncbi:2-succinyl-5-enolpyruvyl-6-hydroxy-3-cyclohexene-1-carboxylic-acid synthase [Tenacibaculum sp. E3R01]|uniref:2-succinyl-5-enolpyruvyl-6-hydroxy-3- cyclohexene-1-carboxylic-acid synthase n=1 Tax=Tenacibaculum sp. E3R01 TaxID=2267227 RepID=UPI000DE8B6C4|nr:2-succinyl-5-enolpyruvyl-6-hydroxy-3-cyclohexene-1-carboxylic-acid synthase [Tenacibaculum sp. E3R01]RBW58222.1 2-succinyl-5-enolpyruvyl-6-hydroxy-3-cyclohexene-1-carboxylic-acid synthase [Tenacibaculum sp. E3R01]